MGQSLRAQLAPALRRFFFRPNRTAPASRTKKNLAFDHLEDRTVPAIDVTGFNLNSILIAVGGAVLLLFIYGWLKKTRVI